MADTESLWFKIVVFIVAGFAAGLFLADIIYFNRLRNGGTLTSTEATSMLWLNAILFVLALIVFIWALIRLVLGQSTREMITTRVGEQLKSTGTGYEYYVRTGPTTSVPRSQVEVVGVNTLPGNVVPITTPLTPGYVQTMGS